MPFVGHFDAIAMALNVLLRYFTSSSKWQFDLTRRTEQITNQHDFIKPAQEIPRLLVIRASPKILGGLSDNSHHQWHIDIDFDLRCNSACTRLQRQLQTMKRSTQFNTPINDVWRLEIWLGVQHAVCMRFRASQPSCIFCDNVCGSYFLVRLS